MLWFPLKAGIYHAVWTPTNQARWGYFGVFSRES
jgi:hypothetical protein